MQQQFIDEMSKFITFQCDISLGCHTPKRILKLVDFQELFK